MDDQKIQDLINQFNSENLKEKGYFGIFEYGGAKDESYIKANKEGLLLYAMYLLIASKNIDSISKDLKDKTIPFESYEEWVDEDSSTIIQYIEKFDGKRKSYNGNKNNTFLDKLVPFGCILMIIILVVGFLIGINEIISWISLFF